MTEIEREYGSDGIRLATAKGTLAVSDDTKMTLFTLEGMARATEPDAIVRNVRTAYLDWLGIQGYDGGTLRPRGRLAWHRAMRQARAPGRTCIEALRHGGDGTVQLPLNESKGCGAVMRSAPLGFLSAEVSDEQLFELAMSAAALTHGHPDGFVAAGAMAVFTREVVYALGEGWVGEEALAIGLDALPAEAVNRIDVLEPLLEVFGEWEGCTSSLR